MKLNLLKFLLLIMLCSVGKAQAVVPYRSPLIASEYVNLVIFVPETYGDAVREALGNAGAGKIGNYDYCSFTAKGSAQFRPVDEARPAFAKVGEMTNVNEERIEVLCTRAILPQVLEAVKKVHPYEKMGYHVYKLEEIR